MKGSWEVLLGGILKLSFKVNTEMPVSESGMPEDKDHTGLKIEYKAKQCTLFNWVLLRKQTSEEKLPMK